MRCLLGCVLTQGGQIEHTARDAYKPTLLIGVHNAGRVIDTGVFCNLGSFARAPRQKMRCTDHRALSVACHHLTCLRPAQVGIANASIKFAVQAFRPFCVFATLKGLWFSIFPNRSVCEINDKDTQFQSATQSQIRLERPPSGAARPFGHRDINLCRRGLSCDCE